MNGRSKGNPLSLRQSAVYQASKNDTGTSKWILITSSTYMRDRLVAALSLHKSSCTDSPLLAHLFIIFAATKDWDSYIEACRLKLKIFVSDNPTENFHIPHNHLLKLMLV